MPPSLGKCLGILGLALVVSGCQKLAELPPDFSTADFKGWKSHKQAGFINSLSPAAKRAFLKTFLPNAYFTIEENEVKLLSNGEMVCDIKKDRGGYVCAQDADGNFEYILGYWRLMFDELIFQNPRRLEGIRFMSQQLILDNSSYSAENNSSRLVLIFKIINSTKVEIYGEIPLVFIPEPAESPAIASYSKKVRH